jgi:hypothetical protein
VIGGVSKENTSGGLRCEFVSGFDRDIMVAGTTEHTQMLIGGGDSMKGEVWIGHVEHLGEEAVPLIYGVWSPSTQ